MPHYANHFLSQSEACISFHVCLWWCGTNFSMMLGVDEIFLHFYDCMFWWWGCQLHCLRKDAMVWQLFSHTHLLTHQNQHNTQAKRCAFLMSRACIITPCRYSVVIHDDDIFMRTTPKIRPPPGGHDSSTKKNTMDAQQQVAVTPNIPYRDVTRKSIIESILEKYKI